jgi:hypothetical protein
MPLQLLLLDFPDGATVVNPGVHILKKDGHVTYFIGGDTVYHHRHDDTASYRFILAALMDNGHVRPSELEQAPLCIPHRTLMNWLKQLRTRGPDSFFRPAKRSRAPVMTPARVAQCEQLLASGLSISRVAEQSGVKECTLRKALAHGAMHRTPPASTCALDTADGAASTKSERSRQDAQAAQGMGTACTRPDERVAAAVGLAEGAATRFERCDDVMMGGLLTGLPALCANGLLSGIGKYLHLPKGFYSCAHILLILGFMALGRIRRPEGLRHLPPGELGKVAGLDRVPEVRTLRDKITRMAADGEPGAWMRELCADWMREDPEEAGYSYVDGHVRVYHGELAHTPRRYVSRERLCLRGATDYWVNDALGRPFFVVSKTVTNGLAATLLEDIVPVLLDTVPDQPSQEQLDADPLLHRFVTVFDREGATHSLLDSLWQHRIAAITYRKNVADAWPEAEFKEYDVPVPGGGTTRMLLAERETALCAGEKSLLVKEVRRLTKTGHQTAIVCSGRKLLTAAIGFVDLI